MNRKYKSLITKSFSFLLFFDSIQALDVALVVAVLVLEVGVVSRDDSDHVDGGPGGDDGVEVPLGSPALGLESLGRGVLPLAGVVGDGVGQPGHSALPGVDVVGEFSVLHLLDLQLDGHVRFYSHL